MQGKSNTSVDVAVIGGGITGCAAAWYLSQEGASVALLEAGELNSQASGSNAGSLHAQIPQDTFLELGESWAADFAPTLQLLRESISLWQEADREFAGALEVSVKGGLMLASSDKEMRAVERKASFERRAGTEVEMLDSAALRKCAPYLSERLLGAGYCAAEGKANPLVAAPTFARHARQIGARIFRHAPVVAMEAVNNGYRLRIKRNHPVAGETKDALVSARRVVIAAGASTPSLTAMLGLAALPMQAVPIQVSVTEPVVPMIQQLLYYARAPLTMKQTHVGTILIGGGWPARLDAQRRPVPDPHSLAQNLGLALEVVPRLAKLTVMRTWAATVNGTQDWKPIIGELPKSPGVFLSYVPWMGFTGGPAAARMVSKQVLDRESDSALPARAFSPH